MTSGKCEKLETLAVGIYTSALPDIVGRNRQGSIKINRYVLEI
jgi:hypothetical protein